VRAVHRLEEIAVDVALFHQVGELGAAAVFLRQLLIKLAVDERRELAFAIVGIVAGGFVEAESADVRGEDLLIPLAAEVFADEVLQLLADDRALGLPEDQALADLIVDGEEAELRADDAMVALFGFLDLLEVLVELLLVEEGGAVDALEAVGADVAVPVRRGDAHDLEAFDAAGRGNVGAHAEVFPVLARLAGDVPAQRFGAAIDRALRVVDLVLVSLGLEALHSFVE
jgi:hypothetical protein